MRGELDQRIEIQAKVSTTSTTGVVSESWATSYSRWAKVEALRAFERQEGARARGIRSHRVTMRYDGNLSPRNRIKWGDRVLEIDGVEHGTDRRRYETVAVCVEIEGVEA